MSHLFRGRGEEHENLRNSIDSVNKKCGKRRGEGRFGSKFKFETFMRKSDGGNNFLIKIFPQGTSTTKEICAF